MTPGQPFPACSCRKPDATADSAWVCSLVLAFMSWPELMQELSWWEQEFPLPVLTISSHVLLPKLSWWQHLPEPSAGEATYFPAREDQVCSSQWDVPSGLVLSSFGRNFYWALCSLCCLSLGDRVGAWLCTMQDQLNAWNEARVPFQLITSDAASVSSPMCLL